MTQRRKRYDKQFKMAAAKVVLEGETTVIDLSRELGIKDATLRRWAKEYEEMGEDAFPGNGLPKINKDYEILKLRKQVEELERENELLKKISDLDSTGQRNTSSSLAAGVMKPKVFLGLVFRCMAISSSSPCV